MGTATPSTQWRLMTLGQRGPGRAHEADARIVDLRPPGRALDRHPHGGRHLQRQLMVLERRSQTDDTLGNQDRRLGEHMGGLDLAVGELIKAPRRAHDRLFSDKTGQRLRSNSFGHEVLQPEHAPGFQEIEGTVPLGAGGGHRQ